jgi:hypothetical protein
MILIYRHIYVLLLFTIFTHCSPEHSTERESGLETPDGIPSASADSDNLEVLLTERDDDDSMSNVIISPSDRQKFRVNFASEAKGASIASYNPEMTGAASLLSAEHDSYALSPCSISKKFVVVSLTEDATVDEIVISSQEKFSSTVKDFRVLGSLTFPTAEWVVLGNFSAEERLGEQSFSLSVKSWSRFIKVSWLSHHGSEFYCTWNRIRVYGRTMLEDLQVLLTAPSSVSSSSSSSIATDAEVAVGVVSSVTPSSLSGTSPTPTTQSTSDNIQSTMAALPVLPSASAEPLVHVSNDGPSQVVNTLFDHPNISSFDSHNDTSKNSTSFISIESLNTDSDLDRLERELFLNDSSLADVTSDANAALAALNASILAANLSKSGNSLVVSPVHPSSSNVFVALTSRLKDLEVDRAITHTHISETNDALLALARQIDTIQKSLIALRNQSFGVRHSATVDELVDSIVSTRDEVHSSEERHNSDVSYLRKQVDLLEARLRDAEQKAETMIWNAGGVIVGLFALQALIRFR